MSLLDERGDRATAQLNEELLHAQLELLSAQCATDSLRFRFPVELVARHAEREVFNKALSSANALFEYYNHVARQVPDPDSIPESEVSPARRVKVLDAIARVADKFRRRNTQPQD